MKTQLSLVLLVLCLGCTEGGLPPPDLDLVLKPHMADGVMDFVEVAMRMQDVDVEAGGPLLKLQMVAAGVPSARYESSALEVRDVDGPLQLMERDDPEDPANNRHFRHWTTDSPVVGELTVEYRGTPMPPSQYRGGPVMDMRAEDGGMNGRGGCFLVLPDDSIDHRVRVRWDLSGMPVGARGIWTHGEGEAVKVLTGEELAGTIFMAGPVKSYPAVPDGNFAMYWLTEPNWSVADLAPTLQRLFRYYGEIFQDTTHTMRIFMRRGRGNGGSGAGGSFLMFTPPADSGLPPTDVTRLIPFFAHEIFHQFPEEFDDAEEGEPTYWWSEGVATYYSNLLAYRLGIKDLDEFLEDWNSWIEGYYSSPYRLLSYREITDGMFGPVGLNIMYTKGHAFMMLLNALIREKSGGARSLDDLVFPLIRAHRRGESYTREDFLAALDRELGGDGNAAFESFLEGGELLALPPDLFGPCFQREAAVFRPFELGFDIGAATGGERRVIRNLIAGSAADRAGVREGDEVVSELQLSALRADTSAVLTLELRRDGQGVRVAYRPLAAPLDGYRWIRDPSVPESACGLKSDTGG